MRPATTPTVSVKVEQARFVTVLGPMPPKRSVNEWMDTATDLLAYRIIYGVIDPVVALGAKPDGRRQSRRTAWHPSTEPRGSTGTYPYPPS